MRITIEVADDFEASIDEVIDMFLAAQIGVVFSAKLEKGLPDPEGYEDDDDDPHP